MIGLGETVRREKGILHSVKTVKTDLIFFCSCHKNSNIILVCPMKHAPVLVKLDGQHFSLPNGGEVIKYLNVL